MQSLFVGARENFAFGGGGAFSPQMTAQMGTLAMDEGGVQTSEVTPNGDRWAYNWIMAAIALFLVLYTVSRVLD